MTGQCGSAQAVDGAVAEAIRAALPRSVNGIMSLRRDHVAVDETTSLKLVHDAFCGLVQRSRSFGERVLAHVSAHRVFRLGIGLSSESSGKYAVPMFGGMAMPELKSEFTGLLHAKVDHPVDGTVTLRGAFPAREPRGLHETLAMVSAAGFVVMHSTGVWVKSAGAQHCNWATVFHLGVSGAPAEEIVGMLRWFTTICNDLKSNYVFNADKSRFELTKEVEVAGLMRNIGLGDELQAAASEVRLYEEEHDLRRRVHECGGIQDFHNNSKTIRLDLADHADKVFSHMVSVAAAKHPEMDPAALCGLVETAFMQGAAGHPLDPDAARQMAAA